jgi:hypothetical protein
VTKPLRTLTYTLTADDALAFANLQRDYKGWGKALFYAWIACAGLTLVLLPHEWTGDEGDVRFYVIGLALIGLFWFSGSLIRDQYRRYRAYRAIPAPVPARLEIRGDHLHAELPGRTLSIAYETINAVVRGKAHVFITALPDTLIVPLSAFGSDEKMAAFAADIEARSRAKDEVAEGASRS